MSKSSDYDFVGLSTAMLKDVAAYFPTDLVEWKRDSSRIAQLVTSRGQAVFTLDLPKLGKALDASLASGRLELGGLNHSGSRYPRSKIPRLFWGLWSRLFSDDGCLKQDIDPNVVVFLRGLLYVGKKLELECAPRYLFETVKEFYDVEAQTPTPSHFWDDDSVVDLSRRDCGDLLDYRIGPTDLFWMPQRGSEEQASLLAVCQRVADRVAGDIGFIEPESLAFRHGPGAVSDLRAGKDYKYAFPTWNPRLEAFFPYTSCGSVPAMWEDELMLGLGQTETPDKQGLSQASLPFWHEDIMSDTVPGAENNCVQPLSLCDSKSHRTVGALLEERYSRLYAVPKTANGPRLIAAEPTCNQWIQQGIAGELHRYTRTPGSLLRHSVSFRDQSASGKLALEASRLGHMCTIDLKSASDRLSTQLIQRMFRGNISLLRLMISCRTRFISNTVDNLQPRLHKIRKFSTQGSALTFPVQSIVFATLALGVGSYLHPRIKLRALARQVRVFGDDIIVPTAWEPRLREVLHLLGLRVNDTKTFTEGNFRESCGVDAWCGYDVTPPYVSCVVRKTEPGSVLSNVAVANNFYKKGWWHAASWIKETVGHKDILVIGYNSGQFGFKSVCGASLPNAVWDDKLQKWTTVALSIQAKSNVVKQDSATALLEFFTKFGENHEVAEIKPYVDYDSGIVVAGTPKFRRARVAVEELL